MPTSGQRSRTNGISWIAADTRLLSFCVPVVPVTSGTVYERHDRTIVMPLVVCAYV